MRLTGFFQKIKNGEIKTYKNVTFESTGIKDCMYENGKVIWRKINKDGTPSNVFAEQFQPNVPWAYGKWFIKVDSGSILEKHPELKVETETSKNMTDAEYIQFLHMHHETETL